MRLEYISHSCFLLETSQTKLVFDPWITGTAYYKQWHLFPKPLDVSVVEQADLILISHGHEDHFHSQSLKRISKKAHVFFPYQWRAGIVSYLNHLQFDEITEAVSFKTYSFRDVKITYLGYSMESVIVVECEGCVLVNINDALNSNHETASTFLLERIKKRWPQIDFLLSGWSGAGYFPNKVHYPQKDDVEVGRIREQYFADNFCKFTKFLQPEISIPFAPGFVLLRNENKWINAVKFPRAEVVKYYKQYFDATSTIQFPILYPGDYFTDKTLTRVSPYHDCQSEEEVYAHLEEDFQKEIEEANTVRWMGEDFVNQLQEKLIERLNKNKSIYHERVVQDAVFSVLFSDVAEKNYFNIALHEDRFVVSRSNAPTAQDRLRITTRAELLHYNLDKVWGGDVLSIGYGIDVDVFEELSLEKNLDIVCVRLISRYPQFENDMWSNVGRIFKYYFHNPIITNLWIKQKIKLRPYVNKYPFNERDHWITYSKCDLCKVCNMPELDFKRA